MRCVRQSGYVLLVPLAELLEKDHPLVATRCLRAMVDFSLQVGRSKRYPHAARHLQTCHLLAQRIESWGNRVDHGSYGGLVPKEVAPESELVSNIKGGRQDNRGEAVSPTASDGPLQPGLW